MAKSCKEIAETLVDCMKKSACVRGGGDLRSCLNANTGGEDGSAPGGECQEFRAAYFNCKRGSLDMRTRIKGQKVF